MASKTIHGWSEAAHPARGWVGRRLRSHPRPGASRTTAGCDRLRGSLSPGSIVAGVRLAPDPNGPAKSRQVRVDPPEGGLSAPSIVMCDQLRICALERLI